MEDSIESAAAIQVSVTAAADPEESLVSADAEGAATEEVLGGANTEEPIAGVSTEEAPVEEELEASNTTEEAVVEEELKASDTTEEAAVEEELKATNTTEEAAVEEEPKASDTTEKAAVEEEPKASDTTEKAVVEEEPKASDTTDEATAVEESSAKKLLVLDVNGLLVATYHRAQKTPAENQHHVRLGNFHVYERPGCEEFLAFCFKHFVVGVWSSAREHNVTLLVNYIFKDLKPAFSWHQRHCTMTAVMHPDNKKKPIFLKELSKLWAEVEPGRFDQSNTLLIDDSPYKALKNPPHTAIFPQTYEGKEVDDDFLTVLRTYLEGLRGATNVQDYVSSNPIGEPEISTESPLWSYFSSILDEGSFSPTAMDEVANGVIPAQEHASQLNPEEIELEDMDEPRYRPEEDQPRYSPEEMEPPAKRRALSPAVVSTHSSRHRRQASQDMGREPEDGTAEEIHWRQNIGNGHESEAVSRRNNFERERERSPRMRVNHFEDRRRFAPNHDDTEFVPHPRSSGGYDNRREPKPRGSSWHDRSVIRDPSFSRDSFARRSSEHQDMGRPLPSRQFMTSGINIRDLPPPPVFSAHDSGRGLLPSPAIPPRSWDNAERFDSYSGRRHVTNAHVTNVALTAPAELDRSWVKPVIRDKRWEAPVSSSLERGYDRMYDRTLGRPLSSGRGSEYELGRPLSSGRGSEYELGRPMSSGRGSEYELGRPISSGRGHEYDRRWEEPVSSGRGHEYDRRWEEPVSSGRGHEYDRRWGEPMAPAREQRWKDPGQASARGNNYDSRWKEAPASRERRYDSGWDRPASSSHGMEYDSRWGAESTTSNSRGREYVSRWDENVHSDYRKDYDRWEQPREYESKWSSKEPPSHYSSPPAIAYSYRNSSVEYKGRNQPPADRNMAGVGPRDDHRPYHWGASDNYRR